MPEQLVTRHVSSSIRLLGAAIEPHRDNEVPLTVGYTVISETKMTDSLWPVGDCRPSGFAARKLPFANYRTRPIAACRAPDERTFAGYPKPLRAITRRQLTESGRPLAPAAIAESSVRAPLQFLG